MTKVAIIGMGSWGTKVYECLKRLQVDIVNPEDSDWVVLCTPNDLHYNQCLYWMSKGKNVFCEKPLTFSYQSAKTLYSYAESKKVKLYVDDIYLWRDIEIFPDENVFYWSKPDISGYLERFAYHHFYLLFDSQKSGIKTIDSHNDMINLILNNGTVANFKYEEGGTFHRINGVPVSDNGDPLGDMLQNVFDFSVDFIRNKNNTINATLMLEKAIEVCYKKAIVIGAGAFGCTTAIALSNNGFNVELIEEQNDIMQGSSSINQYRLHKGYHYPRSEETALECSEGIKTFEKKYIESLTDSRIEHLYGISSKDSLIQAEQYKNFLNKMNLPFTEVEPLNGCDLTVSVEENLFDPNILKNLLQDKLYSSNVKVSLNTRVDDIEKYKNDYDVVVIATYSNINQFLTNKKEYQFEVCEKPVVKLPESFVNKSIVIMDGPFACLDPYGEYFVLGNVVHAIHQSNVGYLPEVNDTLKQYINKGIIENPETTNIDKFIETGKIYFGEEFAQLEHIGSMYTVRAVLKNRDHDDARPTLVAHEEDNVWSLFSGKIDTCVNAANKLIEMVKEHELDAR